MEENGLKSLYLRAFFKKPGGCSMRNYIKYFKPVIAILVILAMLLTLVPAAFGMNRVSNSALQLGKQTALKSVNHLTIKPAGPEFLAQHQQNYQVGPSYGPSHLFTNQPQIPKKQAPKRVRSAMRMPKASLLKDKEFNIKADKREGKRSTSLKKPGIVSIGRVLEKNHSGSNNNPQSDVTVLPPMFDESSNPEITVDVDPIHVETITQEMHKKNLDQQLHETAQQAVVSILPDSVETIEHHDAPGREFAVCNNAAFSSEGASLNIEQPSIETGIKKETAVPEIHNAIHINSGVAEKVTSDTHLAAAENNVGVIDNHAEQPTYAIEHHAPHGESGVKNSAHQGMIVDMPESVERIVVQETASPDYAVINNAQAAQIDQKLMAQENTLVTAQRADATQKTETGVVVTTGVAADQTQHQVQVHENNSLENSTTLTTPIQQPVLPEKNSNPQENKKSAQQNPNDPVVKIPSKNVTQIITPVENDLPQEEPYRKKNSQVLNRFQNKKPLPIPHPILPDPVMPEPMPQPEPRERDNFPRRNPIMPVIPIMPEPSAPELDPVPMPLPNPEQPEEYDPIVPPVVPPYKPMPKPQPKPRPVVIPKNVPQRTEKVVVPMTPGQAIENFKKAVIEDSNRAYLTRFGKQNRHASQVEKKTAHYADQLPTDLAQLREEFIQAQRGNMHKTGDYNQCNNQAYESIMQKIRDYEDCGLMKKVMI